MPVYSIFRNAFWARTELFSPKNQNTIPPEDACANANANCTFEDIMTVQQQHLIPLLVYQRELELDQWHESHLMSQSLHLLEPAIEC
jgi:hypothetical protein